MALDISFLKASTKVVVNLLAIDAYRNYYV